MVREAATMAIAAASRCRPCIRLPCLTATVSSINSPKNRIELRGPLKCCAGGCSPIRLLRRGLVFVRRGYPRFREGADNYLFVTCGFREFKFEGELASLPGDRRVTGKSGGG